MSIEQTDKIDIIAAKPGTSVVQLVVTDHLDWTDVSQHSLLLQEKLNTYLDFIESGQLYELAEPKVPRNAEISIVVAASHEPTSAATSFLEQVASTLSQAGYSFLVDVRK